MNKIASSIESLKIPRKRKRINTEQCFISFFHLNYTRGSFLNFLWIFRIALKHILEKISFCPLLTISWFLRDFKKIHLYEKLSKTDDESLTFSIKIHDDFGICFFKFWLFKQKSVFERSKIGICETIELADYKF